MHNLKTLRLNMPKVVILVTAAPDLNGHKTGLWLEECAAPYYIFKDKGYEVVLASPSAGPVPIDQVSVSDDFFTDDSKKFLHDAEAVGALSHSVELGSIDMSTVDCIYLAGGHGACVDFINNPSVTKAVQAIYAANKTVASVCHGVIALADCHQLDGTPLVKGRKVTGFSNSEEEAVELTEVVPYLLESKLKEQGCVYEKGENWSSKVCVDGNLITGQNPQSSAEVARTIVEILG